MIPRIVLSPGEPAGIGPDIIIKTAQQPWAAELVVVSDPDVLMERAELLQLPLRLFEFNPSNSTTHQPGSLAIVSTPVKEKVIPGKLNVNNSHYVLNCLRTATEGCLQKQFDALVTGPINKAVMNDAGLSFTGHTEFLAQVCKSGPPLMLFVAPQTKVALVTTHLALSEVPKNITKTNIESALTVLHSELINKFNINNPVISVCGLNPHAGEHGHLGREEIDSIIPVIEKFKNQGWLIKGPYPADTIFTLKHLSETDAILAMYHDQALPVVKYMGFGLAVNVTLGLPIIRTSVDHGTALDIAGTNASDESSLVAALNLAITLIHR